LCERGVRGFDPCFRNLLDLPGAVLARRLGGFQTIVDPSHGTGVAGLIAPMTLAARAAGLDGAIVEVHAQPSKSRSDAEQALHPHELRELATLARHRARTGAGAQRQALPSARRARKLVAAAKSRA
jgi:3-deoxy-D-arabino-heptulosonate 7-phosphate (DAHP) synthase